MVPSIVWLVRYALPVAVALAGLVLLAIGGGSSLDGGLGLLAAAGCIYVMNLYFRFTVEDRDREKEEAARDYYTEHGHWPEDRRRPGPR